MDKDIAGKWVIALRSGRYEQGVGQLRRYGDFCVLGVLCDVHKTMAQIEPKADAPVWNQGYGGHFQYWPDPESDRDAASCTLPNAVKQWAGTKRNNPVIDTPLLDQRLGIKRSPITDLNDGTDNDGGLPNVIRLTFHQLADLIEANYETL